MRTARRLAAVTTAALLASTLVGTVATRSVTADLPATTDPGNWLVRTTGLTAGVGITDGAPDGVAALYDPAGEGTQIARWADGTVVPLGPGFPQFWLGADTPDTPLLVSTLVEDLLDIDANGDGDQTDVMLTTSLAGAEPVVRFALRSSSSSASCSVRLSDAIAVFCRSELAEGIDLGGNAGTGDQQVVLLHADGTIDETSTFVTGVQSARLLGDGSALVGSVRVLPDGTIVPNTNPTMFVTGMVGTTAVGSTIANEGIIVPETGPTVSVGTFASIFPVGDATWVQALGGELCRVNEDTNLTCLGIQATGTNGVTPIADDAAIVYGNTYPTADVPAMWIVPAGGTPELLDVAYNQWILPLGDGTALVAQNQDAHKLFHVTSTGGITPIPLAAGAPFGFALAFGDGRALLQLLESTDNGSSGVDYNGDGDVLDLAVHLFDDGTLTEIGAAVNLSNSFGFPSAIALEPGGAILVGVDESSGATVGVSGTDRNGDGDVNDMVAAVIDDGVLRNLGIAMAGASLLDAVTPMARRIGVNQALFVVPERFEQDDINGDGDTDDQITMLITDIAHALPYAPKAPDRLLDTRADGPQRGYTGPKPVAGQTLEVPAPDGAGAVVLNVTGLNADLPGFVSVYPCGEPLPTVSNLNLTPGLITPNLVISKVGANGNVCIFTQRSADLIADLAGTFATAAAYAPLSPTRVLDTRADGPQTGYTGAMPTAGQVIEVAAPAGAAAVVLNVTGLDAAQEAFVTVYPCGEAIPGTSNLNLTPGIITPNLTITRVGSNGKVCIYTQRAANLIADLAGTFPAGSEYTPLTPDRVLDTRPDGPQIGYVGPTPTAGQVIEVTAPAGASAVVMNVTGLDADTDGFVTVYPCGGPIPTASNLNLAVGRITPNLTVTQVGANGKVCIYTQRSAHLIADLAGTFAG